MASVREVTFGLLRQFGIRRIFGNPGSTELTLFRDFPADFSYVLGLLLQARLRNDLNVLRDLQPTVINMVGAKQRVPSDFALSA